MTEGDHAMSEPASPPCAPETSAPPIAIFGPIATDLLARSWPVLEPVMDDLVERFYAELSAAPGPAAVLGRLSASDAARLKAMQALHLRSVLDPALDRDSAFERARRVGVVHTMVAVEPDWYSAAVGSYLAGIVGALGGWSTPEERIALHYVVSARLVTDVEGVLQGYRSVERGHFETLDELSAVIARSDTVADLARGVLDALLGLDGVAAGFFGRPDRDDVFQFEVGVGSDIDTFMRNAPGADSPRITTRSTDATGRGPAGRAWRSGEIERSDVYLADPTTSPWHHLATENGWRSSAAVPLAGPNGVPRAILSLYGRYAGYFAYSQRAAFLEQVRRIVGPALADLESRPGPVVDVVSYSTRAAHLAHLAAGEVVMVFQPIVDLATGRVAKLEALARLGHPGELALPGEFLPAFGDTELLQLFAIGLDQALSALVAWQSDGLETGVSLNLPATSGTDERYVSLVERALRRHRVEASRLTLELLETGSLDVGPGEHARSVAQLRELGVMLSEDDLGAGYSSLLRLREVAFDEAKIDQELVRGADRSPRDALHFIHPLTSLAHSLGLQVTVEGLETHGLVEAAVFLGADCGQGYAIARPLAASDVVAWARAFRLDVDRARPRTGLGALAAHLAWENRLAVLSVRSGPLGRAIRAHCPLDVYIATLGPRARELAGAHRELHTATAGGLGSRAHAGAWERLVALVTGIADPGPGDRTGRWRARGREAWGAQKIT
ncbi:MAG TPA: EAL domain-containing protein [Acidimicrobiales bacterium]|nr:EAL domain-containing protein [Acidimicrobiales bacterium]